MPHMTPVLTYMNRKGMTASPVVELPVEAKLPDRPVMTTYDTSITMAYIH